MLGGSVLIFVPCLCADNNNNNNGGRGGNNNNNNNNNGGTGNNNNNNNNNGGTGGNNNNNNNNNGGGTGNNNSELLTLVNPSNIPLPSLERPPSTIFHLPWLYCVLCWMHVCAPELFVI